MRYWTIVEPPTENCFTVITTTLSDDQILKEYFDYWSNAMKSAGKTKEITANNCIYDWCVVHWAWETDAHGNAIEPNIERGYN